MPRLPPALEPLFPVVKRGHRFATRRVGAISRAISPALGERGVPLHAHPTSAATAAAEPGAVLHEAGPAEHLEREAPLGTPAGLEWWRGVTSYDVPPRFVLELPGGQVIGNYSAHLSARGVLDHETSHYFDVEGPREHPIYLRTRLPEPVTVPGSLVSLATRATGVNYYHYLMDLLPRWGILAEAMPGFRPDYLYANTEPRFGRQLLDLAGLSGIETISPRKHSAVRASRLLVPNITNKACLAPRWTTEWLRRNLPPVSAASGRPTRLYVTRGSAKNSRRVVNEAEVLAVLRPLGFEVVDPGALSVQQQIDTFAAASVVVAPHGAGLTNLVFAPPDVRVLELFNPSYLNPGFWAIASNLGASRYRYLVGSGPAPAAGAPMRAVYGDITVPMDAFRVALEDVLA
ncbi:capsular polysaccharide biosynthesis protein [Nocardioides daedukensis]|uniref:Capsular polysaccharide biosynthesis protein n=1 Tax=Nocardioides daedukensis TaxID=634462 RepID=A0A7Y9UPM6_9ACTN|nr:glycosyltransferase family 61 protein [Nocardioides daedukensis]NYG59773.1 capsular polysaccharide biosynthesis protein [Nocardioides daedukensis]